MVVESLGWQHPRDSRNRKIQKHGKTPNLLFAQCSFEKKIPTKSLTDSGFMRTSKVNPCAFEKSSFVLKNLSKYFCFNMKCITKLIFR